MPDPSGSTLIDEIESQTHSDQEANASLLIRRYKEKYTDKPIMRLIQDIQQRAGIYSNALEEIKKLPSAVSLRPPPRANNVQIDHQSLDNAATAVKLKYERFGLIREGNLPNPTASSICDYILNKLARFGRLLLDILATQASALAAELNINPNVTITFQVGIALTPALTIGVERSGARRASQEASGE